MLPEDAYQYWYRERAKDKLIKEHDMGLHRDKPVAICGDCTAAQMDHDFHEER